MSTIGFGRQVCGSLTEGSAREWLVADGWGGYAMGTLSGLRTRRYHGLLMVSAGTVGVRRLGLASLDPVLVIDGRRVRLGVHEWAGGQIDPDGFVHLESFVIDDGVPRWRWTIGDVVVERHIAMYRGRPAVGVLHRVVRAQAAVEVELAALCTWRDGHGQRLGNGSPSIERVDGGFRFEDAYRVLGPDFRPGGIWYRGVRHRVEAERGLADTEDLWFAGTFQARLAPGEELGVTAWADDPAQPPPPAATIVAAAQTRARQVAARCRPNDDTDQLLAVAADQLVVEGPDGPTVVAGYPWFGEWSRDTMTAYEGLLLETGRAEEGRALLERAAASLSEGMLANTTDSGVPEYNTADATLWFLHAVDRHVQATNDLDLAASLLDALGHVIEHHVAGTRHGIRVDPTDALLTQGQDGLALTWMDARINGVPVTPRAGKAVEINALWVNGLTVVAALQERLGRDSGRIRALEADARSSFTRRFLFDGRLLDVVDGPNGDSAEVRPNQLLAISLPHAPLHDVAAVRACAATLRTSLGLRSLSPADPGYQGRHRGGVVERDRAYHQGTIWPWLTGPYVQATIRTGGDADGTLAGLETHLREWGLGSVSETADGDPPHAATGCPFQAWSVAEVLRARRLLAGPP